MRVTLPLNFLKCQIYKRLDETNVSYSLRENGIGMASNHYGFVCRACQHVSTGQKFMSPTDFKIN